LITTGLERIGARGAAATVGDILLGVVTPAGQANEQAMVNEELLRVGARDIEATIQRVKRDRELAAQARRARQAIASIGGPSSVPPTRAVVRRGRRQTIKSLLSNRLLQIVLGAFGASSVARQLGSSAASALSVPSLPSGAGPTPSVPPTAPIPAGNVPLNPFFIASTAVSGRSSSCECKKTDRKKRQKRRCKEKAQVKWASGRKKGKPAGTRCVVWFND
jgi:hypothetical protein